MRICYVLSQYSIVSLAVLLLSANANDGTMVPYSAHDYINRPLTLSELVEPIHLTSDGLAYFLRSVYSHPRYESDVLPNSFQHMYQLLTHGAPASKKLAYYQSIIRLFTNRLKSCAFVNPSALTLLLEIFPKTLVLEEGAIHGAEDEQEALVDILYQEFLSHFNEFKANPDEFFVALSQKISEEVLQQRTERIHEVQALRTSLMVFLEMSIGKLVWSPQDQEKTWSNVKVIAQHLGSLASKGLIADQSQLCDLYITLIERYRFFIELMHESLSVAFFEAVRNDIVSHSLPLLDLAEQEVLVEPRKDRLLRSLELYEARARAREYPAQTPRPLFSEEREGLSRRSPFNQVLAPLSVENNTPAKKTRKRRRRNASSE